MPRQDKKDDTNDAIYNVLGHKENGFLIDDDFVDAVSKHFCVSSPVHWPTDEPKTLCSGIVAVFLNRYEVRKN